MTATVKTTATSTATEVYTKAFHAFLEAGRAFRDNPGLDTETAAQIARDRWRAATEAFHAACVARGNVYNV